MNYKELFLAIGLMVLLTIIYVLCRKFIYFAIKDHDKWLKKTMRKGIDKKDYKVYADMPMFKVNFFYISLMVVLIFYVIYLIVQE